MPRMSPLVWVCGGCCLITLLIGPPVRADDDAAGAAASVYAAATALNDAAQAAAKAGAAESQAAAAGLKEENQNVQDNAGKAAASAQTANAAAAAAQQAAIDASKAADAARQAHQRAGNAATDADRQAATADEAAAAAKAAQLAKLAQDKAKEANSAASDAQQAADLADQGVKNVAATNGHNDPPGDAATQDKLKNQQQEGQKFKDNNSGPGGRNATGKGLQDYWSKALQEEVNDNQNQQAKPPPKDGEQPLWVPLELQPPMRIDSFFDIFFDIVPSFELRPGLQGDAWLKLTNPNAFDVTVVGVDGFLFGDAAHFDPNTAPQVIAGNSTQEILLGRLHFDGPPGSFTAADFSLITDPNHPGLGPNYAADLHVVPAPASVWAGLILLLLIMIHRAWVRYHA